jgi:hypothetical protein
LETAKFHFEETLEIDCLLITPKGLILVECKSYLRSQDLVDLEDNLKKCIAYPFRLGLNADASQHLFSERIECVLFCEFVPSNVLQEIRMKNSIIHIVVHSGEDLNLLDGVVHKRGKAFP